MIKKYVMGLGKPIFAISGDMHGIALDDGSHNYAGGFPITQQSPLDHDFIECLGGPYSHGYFGGDGNYGLWEVVDNGGDENDSICVRIKLKSMHEDKIVYDTCDPSLNTPVINHVCEMYRDKEEWSLSNAEIIIALIMGGLLVLALVFICWKKYSQKRRIQRTEKELDDRYYELREKIV